MPSRIGRLRLVSQRIQGASFASPVEAVRGMLAMQGQDFPGLLWSIGLRVPGCTVKEVERAFATGNVVRSWPMRGTLHATAPEDLPWMLALLAPRVVRGAKRRREQLSLDDRTLERAREVAARALQGGKYLTRETMQSTWERAGISTAGQRGYHLLWHLASTGTLVFGPPVDKEQSFALLSEWVKKPRTLEGDEALGELVRRYLESHGPATHEDIMGWAKLTVAETKAGLAVAGKALSHLVVDGVRYELPADLEDRAAKVLGGSARKARGTREADAHLLPGFDEFVLGYKAREIVIDAAHLDRLCPGGNGVFMPSMVLGGRVVGTWRRAHKAKHTEIEALPFTRLPKAAEGAFKRAAEAYGRFLGVTVRVVTSAPP